MKTENFITRVYAVYDPSQERPDQMYLLNHNYLIEDEKKFQTKKMIDDFDDKTLELFESVGYVFGFQLEVIFSNGVIYGLIKVEKGLSMPEEKTKWSFCEDVTLPDNDEFGNVQDHLFFGTLGETLNQITKHENEKKKLLRNT